MSGIKGERFGGRKKGTPNKATAEIKAAAQLYGDEALLKLVDLMRGDQPDIALKAANSILDRAYGKPAQAIVGDAEQPVEHNVAVLEDFTAKIAALGERVTASVQ